MKHVSIARRRLFAVALFLCLLPLLAACGGAEAAALPPTPTPDPVLVAGKKVFVAHCGACHSTEPDSIIVGPSLAGVAEAGATRVDGLDARAYLVAGFDDLMPQDLARKLTGEELDSVAAYVLSLN